MTNLDICTNLPNYSVDISPQVVDNQHITKSFWFLRRKLNPNYESGLKVVPLRSCLLLNNVPKNGTKNWVIKTESKWQVDLLESVLDKETGEILSTGVYQTDDLKSGNNRKIKAVNRFCDYFNPMYKRREISLFFHTLTIADQSKVDIRTAVKNYKRRLKRNGVNVRGLLWVLEISENLHIHYHLLCATDRLNYKGLKMPEFLKFNDIWGCRTKAEFVKHDVRYYLATYFTKCQYRINEHRSYGLSMPKKLSE
jgi:hypothetical protein